MDLAFALGLLGARSSAHLSSAFFGKRSPRQCKQVDPSATVEISADGSRAYTLEAPPPRFAPKVNHPGLAADPLGRTARASVWDNKLPSAWDDNIVFLYRASWYDAPETKDEVDKEVKIDKEAVSAKSKREAGKPLTAVVAPPKSVISPSKQVAAPKPAASLPIGVQTDPSVGHPYPAKAVRKSHPYLLPRDDSAFETAVSLFDSNWWRDAEKEDPNWWRHKEPFTDFTEIAATATQRRRWAIRERNGREHHLEKYGATACFLPAYAYL